MTTHALGRRVLVYGLAVCLSAVAIGAPPAVQNPWTKAPALPTACYSDQDSFAKDIGAALEALSAEIAQQGQINTEISNTLQNMDGAEKQSRMQSFPMNNPQEAMKMMQANQAMGAERQEPAEKHNESRQTLDKELADLQAKYRTVLDDATRPLFAKHRTLPDGEGAPQWAITEGVSLMKKANAEYERLCPEWWSASGHFHAWLKFNRQTARSYDDALLVDPKNYFYILQ